MSQVVRPRLFQAVIDGLVLHDVHQSSEQDCAWSTSCGMSSTISARPGNGVRLCGTVNSGAGSGGWPDCRVVVMGRHRRRPKKITTSDGSPLKPLGPWQLCDRSLLHLHLVEVQGPMRGYAVDVDYLGSGWMATAQLFGDGRQQASAP